jgi:beta-N-acetylhexosaminidase
MSRSSAQGRGRPSTRPAMSIGPVMLDIAGTALTPAEALRLRHPHVGGVILFARNFKDRAQLIELVAALRAVRAPLLVAVDHEGGRVQRFRGPEFTHLPAMRALGRLWDSDPVHGALESMHLASAVGYVLARELLACGIDLSFTPVLDLDHGASAVIGDRAFHRDARVVTMLAMSVTHGLLSAGMAHCAKHFPGHGFASADSHVALPIDERPLEAILADDAAPYRWLAPTLCAVMPGHVSYPRVAPQSAGFSSFWLQNVLRGQLGFRGAVFSDDLSMQGAAGAGSAAATAASALRAGCDMVLICNDPEAAQGILDGLEWTLGPESRQRLTALIRAPAPGHIDLAADPFYHSNRAIVRHFHGRAGAPS